jgi:ribose 5-phosphate isomerase RpiB
MTTAGEGRSFSEWVRTFLSARFKSDERFKRRLAKVAALER